MKRYRYKNLIYYIMFACVLPAFLFADTFDDTFNSLDDFEQEDFDNLPAITRSFTPEDAIDILTNRLHAQIILQENLYLRTNPINQRSLFDFPQVYYAIVPDVCKSFSIEGFYHHTYRGNFTKDSMIISSYVNLENANLFQHLDELDPPVNIPEVLALFTPLKIQERRAGFMFGADRRWNKFKVSCRVPIYYLERNLFLTESERENIENSEIFNEPDPDVDPETEELKFARKHFISDKLGLGDTRLYFGYDLFDNDTTLMTTGASVTIPTAFAFAKGLYGSHFPPDKPAAQFNIYENLSLIFNGNPQLKLVKANVERFLFAALDRLSTLLIESKLGTGHISFSGFIKGDTQINDCLTWSYFSNLEYTAPACETRFYIQKKTQAEFIDRDYENPDLAEANLQFLNNQLIDTLFPMPYDTTVFPGLIFQYGSWFNFIVKCIDFKLGYDVWWQSKEKLGSIKAPFPVQLILRKNIAKKSAALQQKIFAGITYMHVREDHEWHLSLFGDVTFAQFGVGKDFSIGLKYQVYF